MGAPLRSRSSFTCAAEMFVVVSVLIFSVPSLKTSFYNILTRVGLYLLSLCSNTAGKRSFSNLSSAPEAGGSAR
jgi:hypothetical protein